MESMKFEKMNCYICGDFLNKEEIESPNKIENEGIVCDNCYEEYYQQYCELCDERYDKPTTPEETFFVIPKGVEDDLGIKNLKAGIYKVTKYPFFAAATGGLGQFYLWEDSIKLIQECDIEKILLEENIEEYQIGVDEICRDCFGKYTKNKVDDD